MHPLTGRPLESRYRELDALRGFAALGILFWHYRWHFHATPLRQIFGPFYSAGFYSVDFFFVLSGVVLARAYLTEPRRFDFRGNVVRRLARIYPLHLATLILAGLLQLIRVDVLHRVPFVLEFNDLYHFVLNLLLSSQIGLQRGFSFNGPAWSISTEFYANLIFFLLIRVRAPIRLNAVFLGLVVISAIRLIVFGHGRLDWSDDAYHLQSELFRTIFGFFTGVLLYEWVIKARPLARGLLADGFFVVTLALLLFGSLGGFASVPYGQIAAVVVGFPLLILTAIRGRWVGRLLRLAPFTWLGDVSYSLYLIHFPLQILFSILVNARIVRLDFARPSVLFLYLAACVGLAALSHRHLELPAQARINSWWRSRRGRHPDRPQTSLR